MNDRSTAISILQKARDTLGERLTQRIIDSQDDIASDAEGASYLSEIETIYEQLASRLAHINAMLSNLPAHAEATASEIVYADLANSCPATIDLEAAAPLTMLGLPAPASFEETTTRETVGPWIALVAEVQTGDLSSASRMISELFDIKPSLARRATAAFAQQLADRPELAQRIVNLDSLLDLPEPAAAALLRQCFEFSRLRAQAILRDLRIRQQDADEGV